jgi:hypothetical protein
VLLLLLLLLLLHLLCLCRRHTAGVHKMHCMC